MSTGTPRVYEWKALPWKKFHRQVFKLQQRIYRASRRGETKTVHRLQRLLMKSQAAKFLAVRTVTQDNRGKYTAGIDGVKRLSPAERMDLTRTLDLTPKAVRPVRRVWIPKPGKPELRPLGIPVMRDRAAQTLARLMLEPEWEARFEPNSYGFRPGRSAHDAREAIFLAIYLKPKYVLDADIAACFDRIDQTALLNKLHTFPTLRRIIAAWLKAGVVDGKQLFPTTEGTPQGGAISPLLANIALHGLEQAVQTHPYAWPHASERAKPVLIRYADDFVVLHKDLEIVLQAREVVSAWLHGMGLELKPSKTHIRHTRHAYDGQVGFEFLGFHVRQYPMGKHRCGKDRRGVPLGFKTFIKPSPAAQKRHYAEIARLVDRHGQDTQENLIQHLNWAIAGWANYYATSISKRVFSRMDTLLYRKLQAWARRRHPKKSHTWVAQRYWHAQGRRKWVFVGATGEPLKRYSDVPVVRFFKVRGDLSPFGGDVLYWATRLGRHPELPTSKAKLLRRQQGCCAICGQRFLAMDEPMEVDHRIPTIRGGSDRWHNLQLVHAHCHDAKTAGDGSQFPEVKVYHGRTTGPRTHRN